MKKYGCAALLMLLSVLLWGCVAARDPVLDSLPTYEQGVLHTHGSFQDYTDYGEYTYSGITAQTLDHNPYLRKVNVEDVAELAAYLENFEQWVELAGTCDDCRLARAYGFSSNLLMQGDYFYLINNAKSPEGIWQYSNYTIYYFSVEKQTLYYFHNNI